MHIAFTICVDANVLGKFRWRLVEIDADLSKLTFETKRVMSLINPADTYMVNFKVSRISHYILPNFISKLYNIFCNVLGP